MERKYKSLKKCRKLLSIIGFALAIIGITFLYLGIIYYGSLGAIMWCVIVFALDIVELILDKCLTKLKIRIEEASF